MNLLPARSLEPHRLSDLRAQISRLRQELLRTTTAYRSAAASRNSEQAIVLLRSRSQLMRELLETQCQLLLTMRSDRAATVPADDAAASAPMVL